MVSQWEMTKKMEPMDFSSNVFKSTGIGIYVPITENTMVSVVVDYFYKNAVKWTFLAYKSLSKQREVLSNTIATHNFGKCQSIVLQLSPLKLIQNGWILTRY